MSFIAVGVGAGVLTSVAGGILGSSAARKRERAAAEEKRKLGIELNRLENSRQSIINPWATTRDMSSLIKDTSGLATNVYANLGVATKASQFQAEQADMALASTLDALKASGASAGGATALAQAALQSKQGISANLEAQEANNEKLRAQGQAELQTLKMSEAQRIQGAQLSESQRVQTAEAAGAQFQFQAKEDRQQQEIDRKAGQLGLATNRESQAQADRSAAWANAISGAGTAVAGGISAWGNVEAAKQGK
jgi:beta-galactosidase/beta-glucuronidase